MNPQFTDIFALAEEEDRSNLESNLTILTPLTSFTGHNIDRTVVFIGEKGSGKSNLINTLKGAQKDEAPKPTYAMDYSFAKRTTHNRKEVVNFYELGGGRQYANLIGTPLTKENYKYIVYVIVIDLSKPSSLIDSLNFWINAIKETVIGLCRTVIF